MKSLPRRKFDCDVVNTGWGPCSALRGLDEHKVGACLGSRNTSTRKLIEKAKTLKRRSGKNQRKWMGRGGHTMSSSDSSFSSSIFSSSFAASVVGPAPVVPPPPTAGAGPPPPDPTFDSNSFKFFPSRAFDSNAAQIGSSSTPAASVKAMILSGCMFQIERSVNIGTLLRVGHTVISMFSSARMRTA